MTRYLVEFTGLDDRRNLQTSIETNGEATVFQDQLLEGDLDHGPMFRRIELRKCRMTGLLREGYRFVAVKTWNSAQERFE